MMIVLMAHFQVKQIPKDLKQMISVGFPSSKENNNDTAGGLFTCVLQDLYSITRGTLGTEPKSIAHSIKIGRNSFNSVLQYRTKSAIQFSLNLN